MKVWIITKNPVTDVSGELMDSGGIFGVYMTKQAANYAWKYELKESYMHSYNECDMDEHEVQE